LRFAAASIDLARCAYDASPARPRNRHCFPICVIPVKETIRKYWKQRICQSNDQVPRRRIRGLPRLRESRLRNAVASQHADLCVRLCGSVIGFPFRPNNFPPHRAALAHDVLTLASRANQRLRRPTSSPSAAASRHPPTPPWKWFRLSPPDHHLSLRPSPTTSSPPS